MSFPVFDLHCDTASVLTGRDFHGEGKLNKITGHIDLERAKTLPGYAQCFACFTTDFKKLPPNVRVEDVFEQQLAVILRELAENHHCIRQAFSAVILSACKDRSSTRGDRVGDLLPLQHGGYGQSPPVPDRRFHLQRISGRGPQRTFQ